MRIVAEDTIALIVDYQEKLMPVIDRGDQILEHAAILIQGLKQLEIPILVTQQYTKGLGMTVPNIAKAAGEAFTYYDKITFSCYEDENIRRKIAQAGRKNIIICGVEAHICVLQTVIDLLQGGYRVILVEDCIGSRKENDRAIGVKRAAAEGAVITTYEAILFELTRIAGTEAFKQISKLIK